jgi:hypothetical protein
LQPPAEATTIGDRPFRDFGDGEDTVNTPPTASTAATLADLPLETPPSPRPPGERRVRADTHELVRDFYLPCLQRSARYRRAVGSFTSRGLSVAAQGMFPS